ncbi:hypothetical protein [uncultured Polaribacter sp.]|uniref:hypothetical protein n=1 Tax=uncultured Polaribacter sp. TaxID=174711 RepID=UPI00263006A6|nr:hypothetical protein [uncultured Polaribacter sp.]
MKSNYFLFLLFTVTLFSCEQNKEIHIDESNLLIGVWEKPIYEGERVTFLRTSALPKEAYGIAFENNGIFRERTSGWCGTPPLSFFNIDGNFKLENTLINIVTQNYPSNYSWQIISLTENELVVESVITDQEKDHRNLLELFDEISNLAYSASCVNTADWTFVGYGAKACGGFQGYMPYSKNIDTIAFLKKIDAYTKAEKEYNIQWNIVSDCALVAPPTAVQCQNGYPALIY